MIPKELLVLLGHLEELEVLRGACAKWRGGVMREVLVFLREPPCARTTEMLNAGGFRPGVRHAVWAWHPLALVKTGT